MAKSPKPDPNRIDAPLRQAFRQIESQPVPDGLIKHIDALTSGKGGRRIQ